MIIYNTLITCYLIKIGYYLLTLFQQNHYDFKKYFQSFNVFYFKKSYQYFYYLSLSLIILANLAKYLIIIPIILLTLSFIKKNKYVIKLKITKRIIRLLITTILLIMQLYRIYFLIPLILPFLIILANIILSPVEYLIKMYYAFSAANKLKKHHPFIIAITGSYGKTSTKDLLDRILSTSYVTLKSPSSYNTLMGLSKTINQNSLKLVDFLILEMGAFKKNEIKQMTKLFKPNIRIITEIGPQHMSTFKTIENVTKAKFEITAFMTDQDKLILNYENQYIRFFNQLDNIYPYGINYGRVQAKNIIYLNERLFFDIYLDNQLVLNASTISKSQMMNILCCFTTIIALNEQGYDLSLKTFKNIIQQDVLSTHRLEHHIINNLHIYDDSYSSNIQGFKNASEMISQKEGIKAIITPGIVDGGKYQKQLNEQVAKILIKTFDQIYLIENKEIKQIKKILNANKKEYYIYPSFKQAYDAFILQQKELTYLLIENDLPDSFLQR